MPRPTSPNTASFIRIRRIHVLLSEGRPFTAPGLARELEVDKRTIKRDIDALRDQLGAPVAWDPDARTYRYTRPCTALPLVRFDAAEAGALMLASRTFAAWKHSPLRRAFASALDKLAPIVGGVVSLSADALDAFHQTPDSAAEREQRHIVALLEAIHLRRVLRLRYQKPGDDAPAERTVHPLHLAELDHRWVLIAHDPAAHEPRKFLLTRLAEATPTGATFDPPPDFDIAAYLAGSLGRHTGDGDHRVEIALDERAAVYVRERPWHPTQTLTPLPDGRTCVTLRLNNLIDIENTVLRCGAHAEVLAPPELRTRVRAAHAAALARYDTPAGSSGGKR